MAEEQLPLHLEGIVVGLFTGGRGPSVAVFDRAVDVGIPDAAGRGRQILGDAVPQSGDGRAVRSIHLEVSKSSRRTRTAQEELKWQTTPFWSSNVA